MIKKDVETEPPEQQKSFEDIDAVVKRALVQMNLIEKFTNSFCKLQKFISDSKAENDKKKLLLKKEKLVEWTCISI